MVITPYLDVAVPVPTTNALWATGDAFTSGWSNPLGNPYDVSQKFTRVSNTLYELTVAMPGGGNYKILQDNGRWDTQYHMLAGGTWSGGDFEKKDADPGFPGPPVAGTYKITLDFITGKYTVVKQ
jgi:starch-binding outer membrane protein SusE/F